MSPAGLRPLPLVLIDVLRGKLPDGLPLKGLLKCAVKFIHFFPPRPQWAAGETLGLDHPFSSGSIAVLRRNCPDVCVRHELHFNGFLGTFSLAVSEKFSSLSSSGTLHRDSDAHTTDSVMATQDEILGFFNGSPQRQKFARDRRLTRFRADLMKLTHRRHLLSNIPESWVVNTRNTEARAEPV